MTTLTVTFSYPDDQAASLVSPLTEFIRARGGRFVRIDGVEPAPELARLGIPIGARRALADKGYTTPALVAARPSSVIRSLNGVGAATFRTIVVKLDRVGLALSDRQLGDQIETLSLDRDLYAALLDAQVVRISTLCTYDELDLTGLPTFKRWSTTVQTWISQVKRELRRTGGMALADKSAKRRLRDLPLGRAAAEVISPGNRKTF